MPPNGLFRDFGLTGAFPSSGVGDIRGEDLETFGDNIIREGRFFCTCDMERVLSHACGVRRGIGAWKMD